MSEAAAMGKLLLSLRGLLSLSRRLLQPLNRSGFAMTVRQFPSLSSKLKILDWIFWCVVGTICLGYQTLWSNFAETHISLPFLPFPIFIGEILLASCLGLLFLKWKWTGFRDLKSNRRYGILLLIYVSWILIKVLKGYVDFGPLAFRNAALFYYALFGIMAYHFYRPGMFSFKIVAGLLLLFIALKTKIFWGIDFAPYLPPFPLFIALAVSLRNHWLRYFFLLVAVWIFPPQGFFIDTRTSIISNMVTLMFLGYFVFFRLAEVKPVYKFIVFFMIGAALCFGFSKWTRKSQLASLTSPRTLFEQFKFANEYIEQRRKDYCPQQINPQLYNPNSSIGLDTNVSPSEYIKTTMPASPSTLVSSSAAQEETAADNQADKIDAFVDDVFYRIRITVRDSINNYLSGVVTDIEKETGVNLSHSQMMRLLTQTTENAIKEANGNLDQSRKLSRSKAEVIFSKPQELRLFVKETTQSAITVAVDKINRQKEAVLGLIKDDLLTKQKEVSAQLPSPTPAPAVHETISERKILIPAAPPTASESKTDIQGEKRILKTDILREVKKNESRSDPQQGSAITGSDLVGDKIDQKITKISKGAALKDSPASRVNNSDRQIKSSTGIHVRNETSGPGSASLANIARKDSIINAELSNIRSIDKKKSVPAATKEPEKVEEQPVSKKIILAPQPVPISKRETRSSKNDSPKKENSGHNQIKSSTDIRVRNETSGTGSASLANIARKDSIINAELSNIRSIDKKKSVPVATREPEKVEEQPVSKKIILAPQPVFISNSNSGVPAVLNPPVASRSPEVESPEKDYLENQKNILISKAVANLGGQMGFVGFSRADFDVHGRSTQEERGNMLFRLLVWRDMIKEYVKASWVEKIFGFNLGRPQRSESLEIYNQASGEWSRDGWIAPHNSYLHLIYRGGILGWVMVFGLWATVVFLTRRFVILKSFIGIWLMGLLIYWMMYAQFLLFLEIPYQAIPFWVFLGMMLAYSKEKWKNRKEVVSS